MYANIYSLASRTKEYIILGGWRMKRHGRERGHFRALRSVSAALLLGSAVTACRTGAAHPASEPFQFQRAVLLQKSASRQSCAVVDAAVFQHAGSAISDARLYASTADGSTREIPYALTESAAEPGDTAPIIAEGERVHSNVVEFDLHMPAQPYSEIDLELALHNFVAVAEVTGAGEKGGRATRLGTVTIFDYSSEGLPRSTALQLGESTLPWLHLKLQVYDLHGQAWPRLKPPVVTGVQVPPSREQQVLYTPVAQTTDLRLSEGGSEANLVAPRHVPVERVRLELSPTFKGDFLRRMSVSAHPDPGQGAGEQETAGGEVGRVNRPSPAPGAPPIHYERLTLPFLLGANLQTDARVQILLAAGGGGVQLPVRAIALEMRRRSLCFEAMPGERYTLRYGNPDLRAPDYPYARSLSMNAPSAPAALGPEERNPGFVSRQHKTLRERSPELFWVLLLAAVALAGAAIVEWMRRSAHGRLR